jgi:hypothetical protein
VSWSLDELRAWVQRVEQRAKTMTLFDLLEVRSTADDADIAAAFRRFATVAHPDLYRHALQPADAERLLSAYGKVAAAYDTLRDPQARERYRREVGDRGRARSMPPLLGGARGPTPTVQPAPFRSRPASSPPGKPSRWDRKTPVDPPPVVTLSRTPTPTTPATGRTPTPTMPATARAPTPTAPTPVRTSTPSRVAAAPTAAAPSTTRPPTAPVAPVAPRTTTPSTLLERQSTAAPPANRAATQPGTGTTRAPGETTKPPVTSAGIRAQSYYRKAQQALARGDLGGALFNLRLAVAADPGSAHLRVALAEVEGAMQGKK